MEFTSQTPPVLFQKQLQDLFIYAHYGTKLKGCSFVVVVCQLTVLAPVCTSCAHDTACCQSPEMEISTSNTRLIKVHYHALLCH